MANHTVHRFVKNLYRDSVSLMRFADSLTEETGVANAAAIMATQNNINMLLDMNLLESSLSPQPNDLLLVVQGDDENALQRVLSGAVEALTADVQVVAGDGQAARMLPRSISMGVTEVPAANLALISTPGEYAAAEALKALKQGLNVMLYSDNVSVDDEVMLKRYAQQHGLLCMGPDCGTAIINGVPLGFANAVNKGHIGLIGASGTGLQEVSCLISNAGKGISQAIGVGSRDLSTEVGGISMLMALDVLANDPETQTIILISKPPNDAVAAKVVDSASKVGKPVIAGFIGVDVAQWQDAPVTVVRTLEKAAFAALGTMPSQEQEGIAQVTSRGSRQYLRGLFSGGTLCYEALLILEDAIGPVKSNTPLEKTNLLRDVWQSAGHTCLDLGDDTFTVGRPHPMIDMRLRSERILQEAADPETAVILLDVVLGHGAHSDPAGELIPVIQRAQQASANEVAFVAYVCGTEADLQGLRSQVEKLKNAGVQVASSNAQAARMAATLLEGNA